MDVACPCPHTLQRRIPFAAGFFPLSSHCRCRMQGRGARARAGTRRDEKERRASRWRRTIRPRYERIPPLPVRLHSYLCVHYMHTTTWHGVLKKAGRQAGQGRVGGAQSTSCRGCVVEENGATDGKASLHPLVQTASFFLAFWGRGESPDLGSCPSQQEQDEKCKPCLR